MTSSASDQVAAPDGTLRIRARQVTVCGTSRQSGSSITGRKVTRACAASPGRRSATTVRSARSAPRRTTSRAVEPTRSRPGAPERRVVGRWSVTTSTG